MESTEKNKWKYILVSLIAVGLISGGVWIWFRKNLREDNTVLDSDTETQGDRESIETSNLEGASEFRSLCVRFIRGLAEKTPEEIASLEDLQPGDWRVSLSLYYQGKEQAKVKGEGKNISQALADGVIKIKEKTTEEEIQKGRFLISFSSFDESFDFIEYEGEGKELKGDLIPIREMDKELIVEKLEEGKDFLFRMMHPEKKGFYKRYDAVYDSFQERIHTVYSASIVYTLMKIDNIYPDERVDKMLADWGNFLLSMQDLTGETRGAFHYSYYTDTREKELRFVVGTAALNIFTLLDMYERTAEENYLEAAELAGDWLLTMQREDGVMKPYKEYENGEWQEGNKESLLYNGQVLSALSRLYEATEKEDYYNTANKIATHFVDKVGREGCFLGDEYRSPNPISSAWVVMSLWDFYKIDSKTEYKNLILDCSRHLAKRQMKETEDPLYKGRWNLAFSTSGNGWLAEVMMEMYHFCQQEKGEDCDIYKESVVQVIRWLIQHTYSQENSFYLENPERAQGGLFWDYDDKYVRTDSVCHGLNAYAGIVEDLEEGTLISLPEENLNKFFKQNED